jgi:NACalpha-BTF3-like transcription factor
LKIISIFSCLVFRYFFKLSIITKGDIATLDEYDEEDIAWETDEVATADKDGTSLEALETVEGLKAENTRLKSTIKALVARVTELEALVQNKCIDSDLSLDSITFANEVQGCTASATSEEPLVRENLAETFEFLAHKEIVRETVPTSSIAHTMLKEGDIALLVEELEVSREEAEALLCANNGNVQEALAAVIADPTSLTPFAVSNEGDVRETRTESSQSDTAVVEVKQQLNLVKENDSSNPVISLDDEEEEDDWEV